MIITKVATVVYCILAATSGRQAEHLTINSNCGEIKDGLIDKYCRRTGFAHWFVVLDASFFTNRISYYYEQKQLANEMVRWIDAQVDPELAYKFEVCVMLATDKVQVMQELCRNDSIKRFPDAQIASSKNMLLAKVLNEIDKKSVECDPNNSTQRIVLYIAQSATVLAFLEADGTLIRWKEEYYSAIRATQVYFFVLSETSDNVFDDRIYLEDRDVIRGHLYLNPELPAFKRVREILGKHAVQCACLLSEDCRVGNGTVIKPCHFNILAEREQCSMMINTKIESKPKHARRLEKPLLSCGGLGYRNLVCDSDICTKDCDKKGWSSWSACDGHGNKIRSRLDTTDSHSEFTESCPKIQTVPCVLTSTTTTTATTTITTTTSSTIPTTTNVVQTSIPTSTWALIVALLVLSSSIAAAIVVFVSVMQRRRRRRSRSVAVHHKSGDRQLVEPDSAASTATESRAASKRDASTSRGPSSTWGRGSVSFTNVDDSQKPKRRQDPQRQKQRQKPASSKIKKDDRRKSTSQPAKKSNKNASSSYRPRSASVHVSLNEQQRPSDKKSKSSKVTNSQQKKKIG